MQLWHAWKKVTLNMLTYLKFSSALEIVYIATLHFNHAELSKMMLKSGKHVLCEKPMTMNLRQAEEVLAVAKEEGKLFVDVSVRCVFYSGVSVLTVKKYYGINLASFTVVYLSVCKYMSNTYRR